MLWEITYTDEYGQWGDDTIMAFSEESALNIFTNMFPDATVLTIEEISQMNTIDKKIIDLSE